MALEIKELFNPGQSDEFLSIYVNADLDLFGLAIYDNTYSGSKLSGLGIHAFIFPNFLVKKGDFIRLYTYKPADNDTTSYPATKEGKIDEKVVTRHFFYWNRSASVWNADGDTAHIIETSIVTKKDFLPRKKD